jgi:N-acetylglucosamine kinase-like BadF-type ATPase
MKIIADCGATKSEWRIIHSDGDVSRYSADGINATAMSAESIIRIISEIGKRISATEHAAAEIYLYMAGIASEGLQTDIQTAFEQYFPVRHIEIQSDLLAAARAVCGHNPGIAAILGTGSNSCLFDGENIIGKVNAGGFILGDEGSAAVLGKTFISDYLKGLVPFDISEEFAANYPADYKTIVTNVYNSSCSPSGYLGSFAPFILKHYADPYIKEMVDSNFRGFFRRCIKQYDTDRYSVGIVGGFGYALKDIISRIAEEEGITISVFLQQPIDGLLDYHI